MLLGADWTTIALLAGIALAEGLRKVPEDAIILRALGLSDWLPLEGRDARAGWRLVSWWPPLTRHVVVAPPAGEPLAFDDVAARVRLVERRTGVLEALGALQVIALVLGIPIVSSRFSGQGFLASLGAVLVLTALCCVGAFGGFRALGLGAGEAWKATSPLLSPFATSQAAERVLEAALRGAAPVAAARVLMEPEAFRRWVRPFVYDVERTGDDPQGVRALLADGERHAVLGLDGAEGAVCPRCRREYRSEAEVCVDCEGLPLVRTGAP